MDEIYSTLLNELSLSTEMILKLYIAKLISNKILRAYQVIHFRELKIVFLNITYVITNNR